MLLVILIDIIIYIVFKMSRLEGRRQYSSHLFFEIHTGRSADSPVAKHNKSSAHSVNLKRGLMCLMLSSLPRPRRIKPGHGVFLSGS